MAIHVEKGVFMGFVLKDNGDVTITYKGTKTPDRNLTATPRHLNYSERFQSSHTTMPNSWIWTPEYGWFFSEKAHKYVACPDLKVYQLSIDSYGAISYLEITGQKYASA